MEKKNWRIGSFLLLMVFMIFYKSIHCLRAPLRAGNRATHVFILRCSSSNRNEGKEVKGEYDYHIPVMRDECCSHLLSGPAQEKGVFVDCTVGGGGHTKAILERGGKVIGFDQDPEALAETSRKLATYIESGQLELVRTNFRNIARAVGESRLAKDNGGICNGVLMDLGISSHQINEPGRGFAFSANGPLDMRMGGGCKFNDDNIADIEGQGRILSSSTSPPSLTAAMICNEYDQDDIVNILYEYGEERRSRKLAREIVASRPISTTRELVDILSRVTPPVVYHLPYR